MNDYNLKRIGDALFDLAGAVSWGSFLIFLGLAYNGCMR